MGVKEYLKAKYVKKKSEYLYNQEKKAEIREIAKNAAYAQREKEAVRVAQNIERIKADKLIGKARAKAQGGGNSLLQGIANYGTSPQRKSAPKRRTKKASSSGTTFMVNGQKITVSNASNKRKKKREKKSKSKPVGLFDFDF